MPVQQQITREAQMTTNNAKQNNNEKDTV